MTTEQIATLNAARTVLAELERWTHDTNTHNDGIVHEAATAAGNAIFRVLNVAHNYTGVPMTAEQLHNTPEEVSEPQSLRA